MTTAVNGQPYSVAFSGQAQLIAAQGELAQLPPLGQLFDLVELRSSGGEVLSITYTQDPPHVERGRAVLLIAVVVVVTVRVVGSSNQLPPCPLGADRSTWPVRPRLPFDEVST